MYKNINLKNNPKMRISTEGIRVRLISYVSVCGQTRYYFTLHFFYRIVVLLCKFHFNNNALKKTKTVIAACRVGVRILGFRTSK